jgi:PKD repeat protein
MIKKRILLFILYVVSGLLLGCFKEVAIPIEGDFAYKTTELVAPATISIENKITGAETYIWAFEGGTPAQSSEKNPVVIYSKTGTYKIKLIANNQDGQQKIIEKTITK